MMTAKDMQHSSWPRSSGLCASASVPVPTLRALPSVALWWGWQLPAAAVCLSASAVSRLQSCVPALPPCPSCLCGQCWTDSSSSQLLCDSEHLLESIWVIYFKQRQVESLFKYLWLRVMEARLNQTTLPSTNDESKALQVYILHIHKDNTLSCVVYTFLQFQCKQTHLHFFALLQRLHVQRRLRKKKYLLLLFICVFMW